MENGHRNWKTIRSLFSDMTPLVFFPPDSNCFTPGEIEFFRETIIIPHVLLIFVFKIKTLLSHSYRLLIGEMWFVNKQIPNDDRD